MKSTRIAGLATLAIIGLASIACGGGSADAIGEETIAEAVSAQTLSTYREASLSISTNHADFTASCASSGTVDFSEFDGSSGEVCYSIDSRSCSFDTARTGSLELENEASMCGDSSIDIASGGDMEALMVSGGVQIDGEVTVTRNNSMSRTCDYSLTLDGLVALDEDGSQWEVRASGHVCGNAGFSATMVVDLSTTIE